jgi:hypothetical protein
MKYFILIIIIVFSLHPNAHSQSLEDQAIAIRKSIEAGPPQFSLIGEIQKGLKSDYSVNGEDFIIDSETRVTGELKIGKSVMIRGQRIGSRNYAKKIFVQNKSVNNVNPTIKTPDEVQINPKGPAPLPGPKSKID